ncbi:MAG: MFS transporter [Aeriscardovia sp.]|nr:MFS transporter [Aeriscardovia sp.]
MENTTEIGTSNSDSNGSFNSISPSAQKQSLPPNTHKYKPWAIWVGCCVLEFIGQGLEGNTRGQFYHSLRAAFHAKQDQVSLIVTFQLIATVVILIVAGNLLEKINVKLLLSVCIGGSAICYLCCYFVTSLWQMYVIFFINGLFYTIPLILAPTILLSNWFAEKFGTVLSLMFAFTAFGGTIFQPLAVVVIEHFGWRGGYIAIGLAFAICLLPFTLFVLKFKPDRAKGEYAWGEENLLANMPSAKKGKQRKHSLNPDIGLTTKQAFTSGIFVVVVLMVIFFEGVRGFDSYMQPYQRTAGLSAITAASICSFAEIGSLVDKTYGGYLLDKLNTNLAVAILAVPGILGWIGLLSTHYYPVAVASAFFAGSGTGTLGLIVPWVTRQAFGGKEYSVIYSRISIAGYGMVALCTEFYGWLYDILGKTYKPVLVIVICCFGLAAITACIVFANRPMKKLEAQEREREAEELREAEQEAASEIQAEA